MSLEILHFSPHFIAINKPFDVIMNSDDPERISVAKMLSQQLPETANAKLKVNKFTEKIMLD